MQALVFDKIANADVLEGDGRLADEELRGGGFSGARRAAEDDDGRCAVCSVAVRHCSRRENRKELRGRGCRRRGSHDWIALCQSRPTSPATSLASPTLGARHPLRLPLRAVSLSDFVRHTGDPSLQVRHIRLFLIFSFRGAMSPRWIDDDSDDDSASQTQTNTSSTSTSPPSVYLSSTPPAPSNGGTVPVPSPGSQPHEPAASMVPLITTTASVYFVNLSTNIPIQAFPPEITMPASLSYTPAYIALPDGSLLTPLYMGDLTTSNARLFGGSALLTLSIVNVWMAITFLRRAQLSSIKDKTLFYLLLASQVMGSVAFASLLVPFFLRSANCFVYVKHSSN